MWKSKIQKLTTKLQDEKLAQAPATPNDDTAREYSKYN